METQPSERAMKDASAYPEKAIALEREACRLREAGQIEKAFAAYDEAARLYRDHKEPLKSSVCFAAVATCWNIHTGWQPLNRAATRNHMTADEAMKAKNFDYARSPFREAALLYEKEGDYKNYSICYSDSQRAGRKRSWGMCFGRTQMDSDIGVGSDLSFRQRVDSFFMWFFSFFLMSFEDTESALYALWGWPGV